MVRSLLAKPVLLRRGAAVRVLAARPPFTYRSVRVALALNVIAAFWFGLGPGGLQLVGIRAIVPALAGMTAVGMWRLGADRALPLAATRFWLVLSLALLMFTVGMVVDFAATGLSVAFDSTPPNAGERMLYPVAGLFAIIALVVYPTAIKSIVDRVKIALDISIVLFGGATFVWYFNGSRVWNPIEGWIRPDLLVLPALTLVAGFAVLRITLAGANVICRRTMYCFVFAAGAAATSIFLQVDADTPIGRFGSMLQVLALGAVVLGVAIQRATAPGRPSTSATPARPGWRRPFSVLPYGALAATIGLLLVSIGRQLTVRQWTVAIGVLLLCAAVVLRQLTALWENSRLLEGNRMLTTELEHQAYHDHLTGLANRALFADLVGKAIDRTRPVGWRRGGQLAVLFVDLDDFKIVNDSLGHHVGDDLLVAVADRLRETVDSDAVLSRLGGDEFAVLLEDTDVDAAVAVARDVVAALGRPLRPAGIQVRVEASVGIALASGGEPGPVELLRNADVAMYTAKSHRGGGWRVFEPAMLNTMLRRHGRRAALLQAVEQDEFEIHYQPIVDLVRSTIVGAEALLRWRVDGELNLPDDFVPLAEETGLIAEIDANVLVRACRQAVRWRAHLSSDERFDLHVNISPRQLHRPELIGDVERALRVSGLPACHLTLEITEPGLSHDEAAVTERLRALSRLGLQLAIDDFGTGHSSLSHLRTFPADIIKIDKVFVDELRDEVADSGQPFPVAKGLIVLATTLGIQTIAEGIEVPEQIDRLVKLGCTRGQGYHFGRPMTSADLTDLLAPAISTL